MNTENTAADQVEAMSLTEIAGLDLGEVQAKVRETLPIGEYFFEIEDAELGTFTAKDVEYPQVVMKLKIVQVAAAIGQRNESEEWNEANWDELEGRMLRHQVNFWDVKEDLGWFKGLAEMITGAPIGGSLGELLETLKGTTFGGRVTHRKDKNDPDIVYAGLSTNAKDIVSAASLAEQQAAA